MDLRLFSNNTILARCDDKVDNLYNKNISLLSEPATHFESNNDRDDYLMYNNVPLEPDNNFYESDTQSHVKWTYVADYTTHSLSHAGSNTYYIHCRINNKNALEFGVFNTKIENKEYKIPLILSKNICNRNQQGLLNIANKEDSERFLLSDNNSKIKLSANPKFAGYIVNEDVFIINEEARSTLGHIWTYWYAIENNTLYFCGFPLYIGEDRGHISGGLDGGLDDNEGIRIYDIPPTPIDANIIPTFGEAYNMIFANDGETIVKNILEKYGDDNSSSVVASFPTYKLQNDIKLDITAAGLCGGVLNGEIYDADDIDNIEYIEETVISGDSGYLMVPTKLPISVSAVLPDVSDLYSPTAVIVYDDCYLAYNFVINLIGNSYDISITPATYILDGAESLPIESPYEKPGGGNYGFNVDYIIPGGGGIIGGGGTKINRKKKTKEKEKKLPNVTIEHEPVGTFYIDDTIYRNTTDLDSLPKYYTEIFYSKWNYSINETGIGEESKYKDYQVDLQLKRKMDFYIKFNPLYENTMTYRVKKQLNFGRIFYPADWQDLIIYSPSDGNHAHSGAGFMRFKFDKDENGNLSVYNKVTNPPEHWTESGDNYSMQLDPVDEPIKTPKWELIKEDEGGGEEHYHFIVPLDYTFRFTPEDPLISFVKKPELVKNIQNFISTNACEIVPLDIYGQASIKTSFRVPANKISPELYKRKCRITYRMKQAWVKARKTVIDKIIQSEIRKRIAELSLDDFKCEYKNFKNNTNVYGNYSPIISFKAFQLPSHDGVHECSAEPRQSAAFKEETKIMFITADNKLNDTYSLTESYGKGTPITNLTPAVLLNSSNKPTKLGLRELKGDSDLVLKGVINETVMSGDKINLGIEPTNISIVEHNPRANNWCEVDFEDLGNEQATDVWRYNFELEGSGEGIPTISISSFKPEDYIIALYQVEQPLTPETTE